MFIGETYISEAVKTHVRLFGTAFVWGVVVAVAYDMLRVLRRIIKTKGFLYCVQEFVFWLAAGAWIFHLLYVYDDGQIRSYTMLGMLLGIVAYEVLFGRWLPDYIGKCVNSLINLLKNVIKASRM